MCCADATVRAAVGRFHRSPPDTGRAQLALVMIWIRRNRRGSDRYVNLKTAIFFVGAGTWIAGVLMEDTRVTAAAIVMLAIGIVLRVLSSFSARRDEERRDGEPPG
jgi:low temperature requirement protein LtrA